MGEKTLKLILGKPENGWLTWTFSGIDLDLIYHVSNVPNDPVEELRTSLGQIPLLSPEASENYEIQLSLEPEWVFLTLEQKGTEFHFTIERASKFGGKRKEIAKVSGTARDILYPLFRGAIEFYSHDYEPPHWNQATILAVKKLSSDFSWIKRQFQ